MINKLIELLKKYIEEYEEKEQKYELLKEKISLYEELIPLLQKKDNTKENEIYTTILLRNIYNNDYIVNMYYKLVNTLLQDNTIKYNNFVKKIILDYKDLSNGVTNLQYQLENSKYLVTTAKKSVFFIRNRKLLFNKNYTFINLRRIISYFAGKGEINKKEEILILNELEYYNRNIYECASDFEKEYSMRIYNEVPNILNGGFEMYDEIEVSMPRKNIISEFVNELKASIQEANNKEIITLIEEYKKYGISDNEYVYIVNEMLKVYLNKSLDYYEILLDASIHEDRSFKNDVIRAYYKMVEKYLLIRQHYNEITNIEVENDIDEPIIQEDYDFNRRLIFSHPASNPTKSKFMLDIKDIPEECYQTIYDMIHDFLENKIRTKNLTNNKNAKNVFELKNNQIRIIVKHVKEGIYCIFGVFVKKANNDRKAYQTMCNRIIPDISSSDKAEEELELSQITLNELEILVQEKARKGTR